MTHKKIDASIGQACEGIAAQGNLGHWGRWIASLEELIEARHEATKSLSDAPCYVSWLLLSSEYVAYRLRWFFYVDDDFEHADVFDHMYGKLLDRAAERMPADVLAHARFAVQVRHIFVHKGFPNPQDAPARTERCLDKGAVFSRDDVWRVRNLINTPADFEAARAQFNAVHAWISRNEPGVTYGI